MWMIPTLKLFMGDSNLRDILDEVQDFSAANGPILFGTDVGFITDYDPTDEYLLMEKAGMDFSHVLESLTSAPARRFNEINVRGQVKQGLNADLVVVQGDPERDIRALTHVNYVFRDGRIVYPVVER